LSVVDDGRAAPLVQPAHDGRADHVVGLDLGNADHVHAEAGQGVVKAGQGVAQHLRHGLAPLAVTGIQGVAPGRATEIEGRQDMRRLVVVDEGAE